ncbi:winged helix-turn-helix domain-containing protein [Desulfolutivibrio sulfoxidireducens]|uniref:winged helix-turn-helix domain-containing protein n=1 Tax=Desulfolutivibrio sulfoxidireducens TaxID=2773299 RepID=UPI00159E0E24|nr:winged helix-turn-helix domain-containing protein [Desulfolutivibrio sulfoxidireducens]QLA14830.1 winged helix-turn-helix domain-containing protein [Desulfolutivibrio sulfoxidireducens]QLA18401.1 winged helix-turn-helix domain-containing protein [Desulfolutivibrio sulfoxidireducens]
MKQDISEAMPGAPALKALRAERQEWIAAASARARDTRKATTAVRECLGKASATVPEIAKATGLAPDRTLWLVASMKKFGEVVEADKDGGFYRYALCAEASRDLEE